MSNDSVAAYQRPLLGSAQARPAASKPLPKYLYRRGITFYFKRKIPLDVAEGFAQFRGQVWKSLGTALLETARLRLAVEVTEFDLTVARVRKNIASQQVGEHALQHPAEGLTMKPGGHEASRARQDHLNDEVTRQEVIGQGRACVWSSETELDQPRRVPLNASVRAHPASPQTGKVISSRANSKTMHNRPTLLHLLES